MGTPLWFSFLLALISGGIAYWAATRSATARNAAVQLASATRKSKRDKELSIGIDVRGGDYPGTLELFIINLNADLIYIPFGILNDHVRLFLHARTFGRITAALKPAEETVTLLFSDPSKVSTNSEVYFDLRDLHQFEIFIFMASDPDHMHIQPIRAGDGVLSFPEKRRIGIDDYNAIVERFNNRSPS